ncbi:MAG: lysylphosphatidylglycerol synthase transmembrane domain-containing protein [Crocinitomicaceae bacterium]
MNNPLGKLFSGWRLFAAIAIGLLVSGWMIYRSVSETQFIESTDGKGTHEWVDANQNGTIDYTDPAEFKKSENGTYIEQTFSAIIGDIDWSFSAVAWLLGAVLFTAGRDFFYILRIRILTKNKLGWKAAFYVIMIWEFASALSPGVVGGAAVAMFILNRETIPFGRATAIVIITAFMDNLFFVVMIPLVFLFVRNTDLFPEGLDSSLPLMWWFWIGCGVIFSVCLLLYLTIFWYPKLATRFLLAVFSLPFIRRWKFIAKEWGKDIETAAKEFKKESRAFWWKVFLTTFASWMSRYLVINAVLNAFLHLGILDNIKILGQQLVLWLFMLVSPTPGGSGVAEFAFGELLSGFTTSTLLLGLLALIWRLISYFPYLVFGSILLPAWIRRTRR